MTSDKNNRQTNVPAENETTALLLAYRSIFREKGASPGWAVRKRNHPDELVRCTIPFVGKRYAGERPRILIYASAENLSGYYPGNDSAWRGDWLDDDTLAENRHRYCFSLSDDPFFPHVHIAPMDCGALATAAWYLSIKLRENEVPDLLPSQFYETAAFGNYAKYSIETPYQRKVRLGIPEGDSRANMDYASRKALLRESHPYIQADLKILSPDVVILPASIYHQEKEFLGTFGNILFLPIYQINPQVINLRISRQWEKAQRDALPASVQNWYDHLGRGGISGKTKENYLSVFTYLDEIFEKTASPRLSSARRQEQ